MISILTTPFSSSHLQAEKSCGGQACKVWLVLPASTPPRQTDGSSHHLYRPGSIKDSSE